MGLLNKIKQFSWNGAEVALFDDKAAEVRATVEVAKATSDLVAFDAPTTSSYVGKIVVIWSALIEGVRTKLRGRDIELNVTNDSTTLRAARNSGILTDEEFAALDGLRAMRNLAVHSPAKKIDEKRYAEFFVMADAMATILNIKLPDTP